ncbi:hypothetical protein EMIT0P44_280019 [Pseudomonas sp. IT-P44]
MSHVMAVGRFGLSLGKYAFVPG